MQAFRKFQFKFLTHWSIQLHEPNIFLIDMLLPSGTCTDGEFIQLRTQGATRPVHVWQLIHNAKKKAGKIKKKDLLERLIPVGGIFMIVFILFISIISITVNTCVRDPFILQLSLGYFSINTMDWFL